MHHTPRGHKKRESFLPLSSSCRLDGELVLSGYSTDRKLGRIKIAVDRNGDIFQNVLTQTFSMRTGYLRKAVVQQGDMDVLFGMWRRSEWEVLL